MGLINDAKELLQRDEIKDISTDLFCDSVSGLLGNPVAIARVMKTVLSSPFFIRDHLFWQNFEHFLNGLDCCLGDKIKFSEIIAADGKAEENAKRIIRIIDDLDTTSKVDYMINASRALCMELITYDMYFRICRSIKDCYISDLDFVKLSYSETELFSEDVIVQDLVSIGLMRLAVIDSGDLNDEVIPKTHQFTELASWVYKFALKLSEDSHIDNNAQTILRGIKIPTISEQDINKIFEESVYIGENKPTSNTKIWIKPL